MRAIYKGFIVETKRQMCLGGWPMVYYTATRVVDGFIMIDDFTSAGDPVRIIHAGIKERVAEAIRTMGDSEEVSPEKWFEPRDIENAAKEAFSGGGEGRLDGYGKYLR